jgi:hypothetical protein
MQHGQELHVKFRGITNGNLVSFDHSSRVQEAHTGLETAISRANALKHQWHGTRLPVRDPTLANGILIPETKFSALA